MRCRQGIQFIVQFSYYSWEVNAVFAAPVANFSRSSLEANASQLKTVLTNKAAAGCLSFFEEQV